MKFLDKITATGRRKVIAAAVAVVVAALVWAGLDPTIAASLGELLEAVVQATGP